MLTSSLADTLDPDSVTPGVAGFLASFLLAVVTILLLRDMVKRLRRVRYRDSQAAAQQAALRDDPPGDNEPADDEARDDEARDEVGLDGNEPPPETPPGRPG